MTVDEMLLAIVGATEFIKAKLATNHQIPSDFGIDLHQNHSTTAPSRRVSSIFAERSSLFFYDLIVDFVLGPYVLHTLIVLSRHFSELFQVFSVLGQAARSVRRAGQRIGKRSLT